MSSTPKRWKITPPDHYLQKILTDEVRLSPLTAQLLINRGIKDAANASSFLSPALKDLHDPFLMKDVDKGVKRIVKAITGGEKIGIYGDYDVDGTSAAALLYLFFKEIEANVDAFIPERIGQGYGLKEDIIKKLHSEGVSLIITTDCGISNGNEILWASELGIDIIVTDHHEVPEETPHAVAVINPKQKDCPFPFKGLAGVGVAFNLVMAVRATLRDEGVLGKNKIPNLRRYLDLVALGTLADVVPLINENRIFVKFGLEEIGNGLRPGIRALKEISSLHGYLKSGSVVFQLVPRLNAAGRLGDSSIAFKLLTAECYREAQSLAETLDKMNSERREMVDRTLRDALQKIDKTKEVKNGRIIVLSSSDWHPGIIGIVASRLVELYCRPTVLIAVNENIGRGSARSVEGVSVLNLLRECDFFFEAFGGHNQAAGFSIKAEEIEGFSAAIKEIASKEIKSEDLVEEMVIDAVVDLHELSEDVVVEMERLAPFGPSNPEPLLGLKNTNIVRSGVVGDNHLKMTLKHNDCFRDAIGFNLGNSFHGGALLGLKKDSRDDFGELLSFNNFELAFTPFIDKWNGRNNVKLKIKELKNV